MVSKRNFLKIFGAHIRSLRLAKGLSQKELGARMNKDFQSIQRVERGGVSPSTYYLYELAEGLGVDQKEILDFNTKRKR